MAEHEQFADDLALHALNALEGEDRTKLEKHLATCSACRLELEQLRGDGVLLALSTLGPKPPLRARQRLLGAVAKEAVPSLQEAQGRLSRVESAREVGHPSVTTRSSWWGWLGWAATAAVIVLAASLWKENSALRQSLASASAQTAQATRELEEIRRIASPIIAPEAQRVTLVGMKTPPQPQGKAFYLRNRSNLVFVANNMPALPPQKAYELWLIPMQGAPIPAGMFKPDTRGSATLVNPPLPAGMEAKAFAITVENEAGATTPTMPIMMMGTGE
jgi:anti-sigma-K factor RskA